MKIDENGTSTSEVRLGSEIQTHSWRGIIRAAEWLGVATDGEIKPVKYDVFRLDVYIEQKQPAQVQG
jgi:hypothetical protein